MVVPSEFPLREVETFLPFKFPDTPQFLPLYRYYHLSNWKGVHNGSFRFNSRLPSPSSCAQALRSLLLKAKPTSHLCIQVTIKQQQNHLKKNYSCTTDSSLFPLTTHLCLYFLTDQLILNYQSCALTPITTILTLPNDFKRILSGHSNCSDHPSDYSNTTWYCCQMHLPNIQL